MLRIKKNKIWKKTNSSLRWKEQGRGWVKHVIYVTEACTTLL